MRWLRILISLSMSTPFHSRTTWPTAFDPLPAWYMAPVMARHSGRRRKAIILAVVGAFLLIEAFGLCSTYGQFPFH